MAHKAGRRVGGLTVAIATVAALTLVGGLVGLPGARRAAPATASAATRPAASLSAGLAQVQTLQGVFVPDGQSSGELTVVDRVIFAVSSNGDSSFDVRYRPDYQAQRKAWRAALKADPHATVADSQALQSAGAVTRRVVVANATTGLQQSKTWVVNPITGTVIGVRYRYYRLFSTSTLTAPRDVPYVWLLSHVLDTALAAGQPRVTVQSAVYRGRPAESATVFNGSAKPAYQALIDPQYGLAEKVTSLQGSRDLPTYPLVPYHLEDLQVNGPIAQSRFDVKPDYRYAPQGFGPPKPTDTPDKYGIDFDERAVPIADLSRFTSSWTLLPTWLPRGYRLASATRMIGQQQLSLIYRLGMDALTVGTSGRNGSWVAADGELRHGFIFKDASSEPKRGWYGWPSIGHTVAVLRGGAMAGWPAGSDASPEPGRNFVATAAFGVSGTAPVATLRRIAESLRQAKPGPHLPGPGYDWWPWPAAALGVAALMLAWRRRRASGDQAPSLRRVRLALIGVAAVAVSALLSWHRLYGAGDAFSVRGWQEPLAVLTVAVALFAGAVALGAPMAPARPRISPRFLTILLGLVTLAGTLLAVVYLPVKARFMTDQFATVRWTSIHSLLHGTGTPLPGPGLIFAIAGAVLIVVGGFAMRTRDRELQPDAGDEAA